MKILGCWPWSWRMRPWDKECWWSQETRKTREQILPFGLQKECSQTCCWLWVSDLQDYRRINVCCFKVLSYINPMKGNCEVDRNRNKFSSFWDRVTGRKAFVVLGEEIWNCHSHLPSSQGWILGLDEPPTPRGGHFWESQKETELELCLKHLFSVLLTSGVLGL